MPAILPMGSQIPLNQGARGMGRATNNNIRGEIQEGVKGGCAKEEKKHFGKMNIVVNKRTNA